LSGHADVVFGGVVSGRPPALSGSDRCVGLFINTLPIRVEVPTDGDAAEWLRALQTRQAEQRQYEFVPLVRIKSWSEVPADASLFETLLVFENYPVEPLGRERRELLVSAIDYHMAESYPLVAAIGPGRRVTIDLKYDLRRVDGWAVQQIRALLEAAVDTVAAGGTIGVGDLHRAMERGAGEHRAAGEARSRTTQAELLKRVRRAAIRR
jgi:non-ribosomal peptide synthetase component F